MENKELSRRQFFRFLPDRIKQAAKDADKFANEKQCNLTTITRPPGAVTPVEIFSATCQKCKQCAQECPSDIINFLSVAFGEDEGTPFINLNNDYCSWCEDTPCISACESGALYRLVGDPILPIAKLQFSFENCMVSSGTICDACNHLCPPGANAITFNRMEPSFNKDACVGCGKCIYYCPSETNAFSIIN